MFRNNSNTTTEVKLEEQPSSPGFRFCQIKERRNQQIITSPEKMFETQTLRAKRPHYQLTWSIADNNVPSLPFMYFLQPTHVVISTLKPSSIATNIENCLKKLSITADFDNERVGLKYCFVHHL